MTGIVVGTSVGNYMLMLGGASIAICVPLIVCCKKKKCCFGGKEGKKREEGGRMETQSDLANPYLQDDKDEPRRKNALIIE